MTISWQNPTTLWNREEVTNLSSINIARDKEDNVIGAHDDVIWVKHHIDGIGTRKNGDPWDTYATEYDREYIRFYEGYPAQGCDFLPAVVTDRNIVHGMEEKVGIAYFVSDELALGGLFCLCQQIPAYIQVQPTLSYNSDTHKLSIDVDAEARLSEMIMQSDLRLTVYVVEDSLVTYIQRFNGDSEEFMRPDGTFVQNGVIRACPAGVWGGQVEIVAGAIHRHYDVELAPTWNPQNMRVVAFVHNYDENAQTGNNVVYNADQAFIDSTTGVESLFSSPSSHSPSAVYDLQGRVYREHQSNGRVAHPSHGLYIRGGRLEIR